MTRGTNTQGTLVPVLALAGAVTITASYMVPATAAADAALDPAAKPFDCPEQTMAVMSE